MTITARIIADSASYPEGVRLTTMLLRYPKFIHNELMTHRVFSRNASSSRAIPVERLIQDVLDDPVFPMHWGKNQPGMQAQEECDAFVRHPDFPGGYCDRHSAWISARDAAIDWALRFSKAGYHKQIINRLLKPFCHINVLVTSTEWDNFFKLRCHPAAQPEMRELAAAMHEAREGSFPLPCASGDHHVPFIRPEDWHGLDERQVMKLSAARCARVSYLTHDGQPPNPLDDLALYEKLASAVPMHASPMEHQATPDHINYETGAWNHPELHGNFHGWIQYRKELENGRR